jgi:hypothetical protein
VPSYSPIWAPHVTSDFPERTFEGGTLVPMKIVMKCTLCGDVQQRMCPSGAVHQWVQKFALVHVHRDPMRFGPQGAQGGT